MNNTYYEILRKYYESDEQDIYNHAAQEFIDETKAHQTMDCNEIKQTQFDKLEDAKAVFDAIKNDKTNWTKSIVLQKVSENWETDENGEEEFIDEEFEIIEVVK
ncbi:hypothetical protein IJ531_02290 [bacterium]|nr:hypothetical protein [bacterium]